MDETAESLFRDDRNILPSFCRFREPEQGCFAYNPGGYLTRRIDRRGMVREFQYDTLGRNTAEIWYDTAADAEMDANRHNTLSFTYDALGRMLSAGDQFASYDYAYDRLGRMISIRQSAFHVDADLRDAIPPASEMPDHVGSPASEMLPSCRLRRSAGRRSS